MNENDYKRKISNMVNQICDIPKLRRIYLFLVVITGGG